jgi:hypothetical protein
MKSQRIASSKNAVRQVDEKHHAHALEATRRFGERRSL